MVGEKVALMGGGEGGGGRGEDTIKVTLWATWGRGRGGGYHMGHTMGHMGQGRRISYGSHGAGEEDTIWVTLPVAIGEVYECSHAYKVDGQAV